MAIEQKWKKYAQETMFNFFILPEYIQQKGKSLKLKRGG